MGSIYSQAQIVYVWLGEGTARSDRAMTFLATPGHLEFSPDTTTSPSWRSICWAWLVIKRRSCRLPHEMLWRHVLAHQTLFDEFYKRNPDSRYTSERNIRDLAERDWTRRSWTYQELLLALTPVIVCGDAHLSWDIFVLSITDLSIRSQYSLDLTMGTKLIATRSRPLESTSNASICATAKKIRQHFERIRHF